LKYCVKLSDSLGKAKIRVDIDDRSVTVAKKVRDAEREWINYVLVIGSKEMKGGKLPVRVRGTKKLRLMTVKGLAAEIKRKTKGMPFRPLALPKLLSMRPIFVGS